MQHFIEHSKNPVSNHLLIATHDEHPPPMYSRMLQSHRNIIGIVVIKHQQWCFEMWTVGVCIVIL
jgi:hypothetical protein